MQITGGSNKQKKREKKLWLKKILKKTYKCIDYSISEIRLKRKEFYRTDRFTSICTNVKQFLVI